MRKTHLTSSLIAGLSLVALNSCTPSGPGKPVSTNLVANDAWSKAVQASYNGLSSSSISGLKSLNIPVLSSPKLAASWGSPKAEKSSNGYRISYADPSQPFQRLVIYGSTTPFPSLKHAPVYQKNDMVNGNLSKEMHTQTFRPAVSVAGNSVLWFMEAGSGGADGAYFSTTGFSVTSGGKTGYYRLVAEAGEGAAEERKVARWFKTVK